jgi:hypothetical protein
MDRQRYLAMTELSDRLQVEEHLLLFLQALRARDPGENGATAFAKALSGAAPDIFAEMLQQASAILFIACREEPNWSARKARRFCDGFEAFALEEYNRLRSASGATKVGSA